MNTDEKFCEERFLYELKITVKALIRGKLKNDRVPINSLIPRKRGVRIMMTVIVPLSLPT